MYPRRTWQAGAYLNRSIRAGLSKLPDLLPARGDRILRVPAVLAMPMTIGCVLMAAGSAHAQATGGSITPPAGAKLFAADVRSNVAYASNISGGDDTLATIRRIRPSDVTFQSGATLKFQLLSGRNVLFLTGAADARRHVHNKILDGEDYQITAGAGSQLGPCSGLVGASFARRRSLVEDLVLPVATNITEQPLASVSMTCGSGAAIGAVQASAAKLQNRGKRQGFVDSDTRSGAVSVGYRNNTLGDISLIAQYSKVTYDNDPLNSPPSGLSATQDFEQYGVGVQYARKIGMRLSGTAAVLVNQLNGTSAKNSGINGNAALTYRATPRIQLSLGYDRSNQASVLVNTSYLYAQSVDLEANYRLSQRISFSARVRGSRDQYRGGVSTPLQIRDSKQLSGNLSGSMKIGRNAQIMLTAEHVDRKADVRIYDFTSDNVTFGFITQF